MSRVAELARRFQARWQAVVDPWWLAPGALGLALAIAVAAVGEPVCRVGFAWAGVCYGLAPIQLPRPVTRS